MTHPAATRHPSQEGSLIPLLGRGVRRSLAGWVLLLTFSLPTFAQSEDPILFDQEISAPTISTISASEDTRSVAFSGRIDSFNTYRITDSENQLFSYNQADLFLDVRLQKGIKAFSNISFTSLSRAAATGNPTVLANIKELFIDTNINHSFYLRSGKQFILWGRNYFWNPVDFINQQRLNFLNLNAIRTGIVGAKTSLDLGQNRHLYSFINLENAQTEKDVSGVVRYEWLAGTTEMGASIWAKPNAATQYGLDMSSQLHSWDTALEVALSKGSNKVQVLTETGTPRIGTNQTDWIPRISLGFTRQFNWQRPNRITLHLETFYNGAGYNTNILTDPAQKALLLTNNLYETNYLSRWYRGTFITISEFPTHSTKLLINSLQNLTDGSAMVYAGLGYRVVDGLDLSGGIATYMGTADSEYRFQGNSLDVIFQAILTF